MTIERAQYEDLVRAGDESVMSKGDEADPLRQYPGSLVPYEAWLARESDVKVIDGGDIKVTDFLPGGPSGEYSSDTWIVVIGEVTYRYERWFTHSSGGVEWWTEQGERVEEDPGEFIVLGQQIPLYHTVGNARVPTDQFREATLDDIIEEFLDRASALYYTRYEELVKPLVEQIKEEIFPIFATP